VSRLFRSTRRRVNTKRQRSPGGEKQPNKTTDSLLITRLPVKGALAPHLAESMGWATCAPPEVDANRDEPGWADRARPGVAQGAAAEVATLRRLEVSMQAPASGFGQARPIRTESTGGR